MHPTLMRARQAAEHLKDPIKKATLEVIDLIEKDSPDGLANGLSLHQVRGLSAHYGLSLNYVLFGEGKPIACKQPNPEDVSNEGWTHQKSDFDLFKTRLNLLLEYASMSVGDIAGALNVSRQSVSSWKKNGHISSGNARRICAMEGIDYEWLAEGNCRTDEGRNALVALHQRMKVSIRDEINRLEQEVDDYDRVCGDVI